MVRVLSVVVIGVAAILLVEHSAFHDWARPLAVVVLLAGTVKLIWQGRLFGFFWKRR